MFTSMISALQAYFSSITKSMATFFVNCINKIFPFVNSLNADVKRRAREYMMGCVFCIYACIALLAFCSRNMPHFMIVGIFAYIFLAIVFLKMGKVANKEMSAQKIWRRASRIFGRIELEILAYIAICVVIHADVAGIKTVLEDALPWTVSLAEGTLNFVNSTVSELVHFFTKAV